MAGALGSLGERRQLLSNVEILLAFTRDAKRASQNQQESLFSADQLAAHIYLKDAPLATRDEKLRWEKELLGLWVSEHPLAAHEHILQKVTLPIRALGDAAVGSRV